MQRNQKYTALILRVNQTGEQRSTWFLTAESGIIKATVFGGPKSHLRATIAPFHRGTVLIYHNPIKDSYKVTDFDVQLWRQGIREKYARLIVAQSVAETILSSHGSGGTWQEALCIADGTLDALSGADDQTCNRIGIQFLWKWIELLGLQPDLSTCSLCGKAISANDILLFSVPDSSTFCTVCANTELLPIGPGARRWLEIITALPPAQLLRYTADTASLLQAKSLTTNILAGAFGIWLQTWKSW
jgi:DNA repair protein RecO (recombination protein O)